MSVVSVFYLSNSFRATRVVNRFCGRERSMTSYIIISSGKPKHAYPSTFFMIIKYISKN